MKLNLIYLLMTAAFWISTADTHAHEIRIFSITGLVQHSIQIPNDQTATSIKDILADYLTRRNVPHQWNGDYLTSVQNLSEKVDRNRYYGWALFTDRKEAALQGLARTFFTSNHRSEVYDLVYSYVDEVDGQFVSPCRIALRGL